MQIDLSLRSLFYSTVCLSSLSDHLSLLSQPSVVCTLEALGVFPQARGKVQIFDLTRFFGRFGPVSCATALCFLHNIYVHGRSAAFIVD